MAKRLLTAKDIEYHDTDISMDSAKRAQLMAETGQRTVPYVFLGDQFIGGYDDLQQLADSQQLDNLLQSN